jgi:5-hydroxyisourate hydrolase
MLRGVGLKRFDSVPSLMLDYPSCGDTRRESLCREPWLKALWGNVFHVDFTLEQQRSRALGRLTTHVLDTAQGRPAAGLAVSLRRAGKHGPKLVEAVTNKDGRCDKPLLEGETMRPGEYELEFEAGAYFAALGLDLPEPKFLDRVVIRFGIADGDAHYHVPLLLSPFGYSTYRGS